MTVLGIDYGRSHVGLALGHSDPAMAVPFETIHQTGEPALLATLAAIAKAQRITEIVVGMPFATTESVQSTMAHEVEQFADTLRANLGLPVTVVDERYTSAAARRLRREAPTADEHALAAMLIVETYLAQHAHG